MTDNTPLNEDDGLEIDVLDIISAHFKPSDNSLMPLNATKRVMQLILADRKKHELRARIDEAQKIYTNYIPTGTLVASAVRKRIKRYKQELKKL